MAWQKQKRLKESRIWEYTETIEKIKNISNQRNKAFLSLMYLSAGRSSEIIEANSFHILRTVIKNRPVLEVNLANRKNRMKPRKKIYVVADREFERDLVFFVGDYMDSCERKHPFYFSKQRAWQICQKELGVNPHWIRHLRITHLITAYDFTEQLLIKYAGWTDGRPALNYAELGAKDFLTKF